MTAMTVDQALELADKFSAGDPVGWSASSFAAVALAAELRRLRSVPAGMDAAVEAVGRWFCCYHEWPEEVTESQRGWAEFSDEAMQVIALALPSLTAELRRELDKLRDLCGAAYQAAGASNWPVEWLDNLSDAANGDPLRHDVAGLLPFQAPSECTWTFDDNEWAPMWNTSCGESWSFTEGGPEDNNCRFCQGCGKTVNPVRPAHTEDTPND